MPRLRKHDKNNVKKKVFDRKTTAASYNTGFENLMHWINICTFLPLLVKPQCGFLLLLLGELCVSALVKDGKLEA